MNFIKSTILLSAACVFLYSCKDQTVQEPVKHHKAEHAAPQTPDEAIAMLKDGNKRFLTDSLQNTDYRDQIASTKDGQHPFACVLSCLDSRIPPEILFDQGIGNIFVSRVAGNIVDSDILGSMEYAAVVKGVKVILVMGHNGCGAVTGAVAGDGGALPANLGQLLVKIRPAKTGDTTNKDKMIDESARNNVQMTIANIKSRSKEINDLVTNKKLMIVPAYYDIKTGKVEFM